MEKKALVSVTRPKHSFEILMSFHFTVWVSTLFTGCEENSTLSLSTRLSDYAKALF